MSSNDLTREEWRRQKIEKRAAFTKLQNLTYQEKLWRQAHMAKAFQEEMTDRGFGCHVSVGGLDSIVLYIWLKSIGIDVPGISVSILEDKSIQKVHKALGLEVVKPYKIKVQVLNEVGFPVISKKIAGRINTLQNPTENNKTVRHAIITGECGEQGHYAKNSRMQLPQKWLKLFGGYENENENVHYGKVKKCDRCGAIYEKNEKCKTKEARDGIVSTIATINEKGFIDEEYDLCDECIEKLYDWMKDN